MNEMFKILNPNANISVIQAKKLEILFSNYFNSLQQCIFHSDINRKYKALQQLNRNKHLIINEMTKIKSSNNF
jgi:CRISPR/Cas system-associated endoribonuclease Cas2